MAKSLREVWLMTVLFGLGQFLFQLILACILPSLPEDIPALLSRVKFIQYIFAALLGTDAGVAIEPDLLASVAWVHPVVLAFLWAHGIIFCTRLPAGEIDRGTIDVLLAVPVSRTRLYLSETIVWLACGLVVVAFGLTGNLIGARLMGLTHFGTVGQRLIINANLYCLYLAVGGLAWLVSSLSDRRGRAVGVVFGIVMASFVLGFFTPFSETIRKLSFLTVMHYYRPVCIVQHSAHPAADMLVLIAAGFTTWLAGAVAFTRRDIRTV